jgi:hypothetical protein
MSTGKIIMNLKQLFIITALFSSLLSGCAGTGGSHQLLSSPMTHAQADKFSNLLVTVQAEKGVKLTQADTDRMTKLIVEQIKGDPANHFQTINSASPSPTTLQALVAIKTYDEGNAFARLMLAGLGQIHIDADVALSDSLTKEKLARYEVTKTFAWGGAIGAFTKIQEVEVGFCKAAADSILIKD